MAVMSFTSPAPIPPKTYGTTVMAKPKIAPPRLAHIADCPPVTAWYATPPTNNGRVIMLWTLNFHTSVIAVIITAAKTTPTWNGSVIATLWSPDEQANGVRKLEQRQCCSRRFQQVLGPVRHYRQSR